MLMHEIAESRLSLVESLQSETHFLGRCLYSGKLFSLNWINDYKITTYFGWWLVDGCHSHVTAMKLATFVQAGGEGGFSFSFLIYHMTFSQTFSRSYHAKILHCLRLNILLPVIALEDCVSQKDRRWEIELAFNTFWETPSDLISLVWEWPLNDAPGIHKK